MRSHRLHRKVYLWWGRWWAVQVVTMFEVALGVAFHWRRPMLDIYLGPLTIALGRNAVLTDQHDRLRGRCRGFIIAGGPDEALL
jgi:hypothetical protein